MLNKCAKKAKRFKGYYLFPILLLLGGGFSFSAHHRAALPSETFSQKIYSHPGPVSLRSVYAEAIRSAKHSIFLSTYTLSDPLILSLLREQAECGISIQVVLDKKANPGIKKKLTKKIDLLFDYEMTPSHKKKKGLMHEKILIIDETILLLGTANMTYASLKLHDNLVIGLYSPILAKKFLQSPHIRGQIIREEESTLCLLPDEKKLIEPCLQQLLMTTKKTLDIAMFTFTHSPLAETVCSLSNGGKEVRCMLDGYSAKGSSRKIATLFQEKGIPLFFPSHSKKLFHHKWALIDQNTLIIGSANWTKSAFIHNKDFFIVVKLNDQNKIFIINFIKNMTNSL